MSNAVILFSGGMDSTYLALRMGPLHNIIRPVFFQAENGKKTKIDDYNMYKAWQYVHVELGDKWLPPETYPYQSFVKPDGHEIGRALMFVSAAVTEALKLDADTIYVGAYAERKDVVNPVTYFPDAQMKFNSAMQRLLSASAIGIKWKHIPYPTTKALILYELYHQGKLNKFIDNVRWCYARSVRRMPLHYIDTARGCGKCGACLTFMQAYSAFTKFLSEDD